MLFYTRYFVEEDIGLYSNMVILGKLVYFRLTQHNNIPVLWNECMYVYLLAMISIIKDYIQYNHENIQIRINKCGVHKR